jgi:hypothetical protein
MIKINKPSVKMVNGRVRKIIIGRKKALKRPRMRALPNNAIGLVIVNPGRTRVTIKNATDVTNSLKRKCLI